MNAGPVTSCSLTRQPHCKDIVNVRYPSEFRHVAVSAASVRRTVEVKFPGNPASLPPLPPTGTIVLKAPIPNIPRNVNHPAFIGIRVEAGFRPSLHKFLIRKYDRLVALGLPHTTKPEPQRSTSLAWHLAVWSTYSSRPRITAESRPKDPAAAACVDSFLRGVRRHISPLVSNILFRYAPKTWIRQQRCVTSTPSQQHWLKAFFFFFSERMPESAVSYAASSPAPQAATWVALSSLWPSGMVPVRSSTSTGMTRMTPSLGSYPWATGKGESCASHSWHAKSPSRRGKCMVE